MCSFDGFVELLRASKYQNATAARRAVGKFHIWSEEERRAGHRAINKHFGVGPHKPIYPKEKEVRAVAAPPPTRSMGDIIRRRFALIDRERALIAEERVLLIEAARYCVPTSPTTTGAELNGEQH